MNNKIDSIRKIVYELGEKINAPLSLLSLPDQARGDGTPHVELKNNKYHYVSSERGTEFSRDETSDLDELLYWIFSNITSSMAYSFELSHRKSNQDSRRLAFAKRLELLETINPEWAGREAKEIEKVLSTNPYDDDIDLRVALCEELTNKGYSPEDAYKKACVKYPLP
jgi:hypothetical protein